MMLFKDVPGSSVRAYRDVDGVPVLELSDGTMQAATTISGEMRPYPSVTLARREGDMLTRKEFADWIATGKNKFDVVRR